MKKILFFMAAAALSFTACTNDDLALQENNQQAAVEQRGVGFDVYLPAATDTRAGLEGTMTTNHLQRNEYEGGGFGVYAYQVQDAAGDATATKYVNWMSPAKAPNFMANEKLLWNATNQGWYYNPLKYWPNETDNDSQNSAAEMYGIGTNTKKHLDRLTFFAYAPYVEKAVAGKPGITYFTNQNGKLTTGTDVTGQSYDLESVKEASIGYMAAIDNPNEAVDLLWGVAPSGGLEYTAVNGQTVKVEEGMPLIDMTKPNVNTNMKFLFQHALARIGVTAVAAVDQIGAGGTLDPNTKITINKITLTGYFGETGILNLDNTSPSVAKWQEVNGKVIKTTDFGSLVKTTLTLQADQTNPDEDGTIATHLQFVGTSTGESGASATPVAQTNRSGVTTIRQSVIQPALIDNTPGVNRNWYTMKAYGENELAYSETTPYYTDANCETQAGVNMPASYTIDSKGNYTEVAEVTDKSFKYPQVLNRYKQGSLYTIQMADIAAGTYNGYQAYSHYVPKDGTPAALDWVYKGNTDGYHQLTAGDVSAHTYDSHQAYTKISSYIQVAGNPRNGDVIVKDGLYFLLLDNNNKGFFTTAQPYSKTSSTYNRLKEGQLPASGNYVAIGENIKIQPYYAEGTYYKRDANYFMVIPTNNFVNEKSGLSANDEALRTVRVMIEYYITTEDGKLANGRAQTKNVIEKDVVFPSIANGKSYNLNLILGLTSVKMEAEVDDWKVINVQADLPQNTAE